MARMRANNAEREAIEALEKDGWDVITKGWPDLVARRGNKVRVLYINPAGKPGLNLKQRKMAGTLRLLGVAVEVFNASTSGTTSRDRLEE